MGSTLFAIISLTYLPGTIQWAQRSKGFRRVATMRQM